MYGIKKRRSPEDCLAAVGAVIDKEAAMKVTSFCWANDMDLSLLAFEMPEHNEEDFYEY